MDNLLNNDIFRLWATGRFLILRFDRNIRGQKMGWQLHIALWEVDLDSIEKVLDRAIYRFNYICKNTRESMQTKIVKG